MSKININNTDFKINPVAQTTTQMTNPISSNISNKKVNKKAIDKYENILKQEFMKVMEQENKKTKKKVQKNQINNLTK